MTSLQMAREPFSEALVQMYSHPSYAKATRNAPPPSVGFVCFSIMKVF